MFNKKIIYRAVVGYSNPPSSKKNKGIILPKILEVWYNVDEWFSYTGSG